MSNHQPLWLEILEQVVEQGKFDVGLALQVADTPRALWTIVRGMFGDEVVSIWVREPDGYRMLDPWEGAALLRTKFGETSELPIGDERLQLRRGSRTAQRYLGNSC